MPKLVNSSYYDFHGKCYGPFLTDLFDGGKELLTRDRNEGCGMETQARGRWFAGGSALAPMVRSHVSPCEKNSPVLSVQKQAKTWPRTS